MRGFAVSVRSRALPDAHAAMRALAAWIGSPTACTHACRAVAGVASFARPTTGPARHRARTSRPAAGPMAPPPRPCGLRGLWPGR